MCGIGGLFAYHPSAPAIDAAALSRISEALAKRGPDGEGRYVEPHVGVVHRRLAIIDLHERANQPMVSGCGRFVLVFNGEIYNYAALAATLKQRGVALKTTSDTEVLLALLARDGLKALERVRGMYAFALYDRTERRLTLARDPFGIKPLYYADDGWTLKFASTVKALCAGDGNADIDPAAAVGFALFGSVPEPFSWYRSIRTVPAGHSVTVDLAGPRAPRAERTLKQSLIDTAAPPDLAAYARDALLDSVRHHLVADVPVGLFLSAGIDSGALAGLIQAADGRGATAVTLRFAEFAGGAEDEVPLAATVAQHYGLKHAVAEISEAHFRDDLDSILGAMDQPSIDGFNTWWVARAARELGLKVALSGLGGDELLGGYPSFRTLPRARTLLRVPAAIPGLGRASRALLAPWLKTQPKHAGLLELGGSWPGLYQLQRGLFMPWELPALLGSQLTRDGLERLDLPTRLAPLIVAAPAAQQIALLESSWYMRHQLLRDADWASMAHGLEVRVPLVDIALHAQIAPLLGRLGVDKSLLANAPQPPLPAAVHHRPKSGFGTPVGRWLDDHPRFADIRARFSPTLKRQHWSRRLAVALLDAHGVPVTP
jgi:asparagine synthase (glutamine-hydrolysing)